MVLLHRIPDTGVSARRVTCLCEARRWEQAFVVGCSWVWECMCLSSLHLHRWDWHHHCDIPGELKKEKNVTWGLGHFLAVVRKRVLLALVKMHCIVGREVLLPEVGCFQASRTRFDGQPCVLPQQEWHEPSDDPWPSRAAAKCS